VSLSNAGGLLLVLSANVLVFWGTVLRRRPSADVSLVGAAVVALLVSVVLHVVAGLVDGFPQVFALIVLSLPFVWIQGFLVNLLARFLWRRHASTAS
jgi:hypothetical protein